MEPIILASGSLRRQEFFRQLGLPFSIMPSYVDENPSPGKTPRAQAEEIAVKKVKKVISALEGRLPPWILAADTLISVDERIFGKPENKEAAREMLKTLSGRDHHVITAMALYKGKTKHIDCRSVESRVSFAPLSDIELEWYLDTGEWQGVAGAYRIQGLAACFIGRVEGSYSAIVGLPIREFYVMLRENGYSYGDL